jgi:hyperosmotically inducible periplasmic protein
VVASLSDPLRLAEIAAIPPVSRGTPFALSVGVMFATPVRAADRGRRFGDMNARFLSGWVVVALLAGAGAASAQDRRDERLGDAIVRQVNNYPQFTIFDDVNARIDQGVVTLTGRVTMPYKKNDIGKRIAGVDGVREVQNDIEVLPVSIYDDQLRHRIARAIYGNPSFWNYAAMANPPIHIIVEHGRVTLTGVVNSNVERMLARSLAVGFGEFSVESQLRTDAEMRSH